MASGIIRSLLPQRLPSPPHSQTEQRYFYKRIFYVLPDRVRDAGREGACWGVGCEGPSAKTLSGRRCCFPRGLPQQGRAPPPFLSTELPREKLRPLPCPPLRPCSWEVAPLKLSLYELSVQLCPPKTCVGGSGKGPGGLREAFLLHFMSPASPLLGLRKEVGDPLKEEVPFSSTPPLWHSCPCLGGGALGVWAGHPLTALAHLG